MLASDGERYFVLYGYWLSTCDADLRLVVEHEMAVIEERHPVLRQLQ